MPLLKNHYTSKDYWNLPEDERAERKLDYGIKNGIYSQSGVREYWIIDPAKEKVVVYYYDRDSDPCLYSFDSDIPVGIYPGLSIKINDLLKKY